MYTNFFSEQNKPETLAIAPNLGGNINPDQSNMIPVADPDLMKLTRPWDQHNHNNDNHNNNHNNNHHNNNNNNYRPQSKRREGGDALLPIYTVSVNGPYYDLDDAMAALSIDSGYYDIENDSRHDKRRRRRSVSPCSDYEDEGDRRKSYERLEMSRKNLAVSALAKERARSRGDEMKEKMLFRERL